MSSITAGLQTSYIDDSFEIERVEVPDLDGLVDACEELVALDDQGSYPVIQTFQDSYRLQRALVPNLWGISLFICLNKGPSLS